MSAPKELWTVLYANGGLVDVLEDKKDAARVTEQMTDLDWRVVPYVPRTPLTDAAEEMRRALMEIRSRLHAAGRRPEECYEMTLIDVALAAARATKGEAP